jgi:hypothetical protein
LSKERGVLHSDFSFSISDSAIGIIDSNTVCSKKNALYDYDNHVYIFSEGGLPSNINQSLYIKLRNAKWEYIKNYQLKYDAEILVDEFEYKIYIREADSTETKYAISKATINGETVYKYWDEYYVEDYKNFLDYHHLLRPAHLGEIMIDKIRGINPVEYTTSSGAPNRPVLTLDGRVDYVSDSITETPIGTTDKIYFRKTGAAVNYRIKHLYHTRDFRKKLEDFYNTDTGLIDGKYLRGQSILERPILQSKPSEGNSRIINVAYPDITQPDKTNELLNLLRRYYENYLEKNIEGYKMCSGAVTNLIISTNSEKSVKENLIIKLMADINSPPLPTGGGKYPD